MNDLEFVRAAFGSIIDDQRSEIARLSRKCCRKNVLIFGLVAFGAYACSLYSKELSKRVKAEAEINELKGELAFAKGENDICCDGNASISKKKPE